MNSKNKKNQKIILSKIILSIVAIILLSSFACVRHRTPVLVIENISAGTRLEMPLTNKEFVLGYTHSVMKTPVTEHFTIKKEKYSRQNIMVLTKTIYKSFGVGLPFVPDEGKLTIGDGEMILELRREFPEISMVISPIANHYISISGEQHMFTHLFGDTNTKIKLYIK